MITLKDIIINKKFPRIEVRTFDIYGEDVLFGFCSYVDGELKSLDGDIYCLDEEVSGFEISSDEDNNPLLVIWIPGSWLCDDNEKITINNKYEAQMLKKFVDSSNPTMTMKSDYLNNLRKTDF